ncbi:hypothetical protein LCGC14_2184410 [marine sediment metagenome]|uniref:Uncharacterized protein n=1 Tax=marine sediment metagenome TaxID=412755 RepID=A0A0F9FYR6_9ZZZZ
MTGAKKEISEGWIRFKFKMGMLWIILGLIVALITLSVIFGITKMDDWKFWS